MNYLLHVQLMAKYNSRMNAQVYSSALSLSGEILAKNQGAFFKSINGTLNHILVGDLLWFSRFSKLKNKYESLISISGMGQPSSLDDILFSDTEELWEARQRVDSLISTWANTEIESEDFNNDLTYKNTRGEVMSMNFGELVAHVFNHQTHHRGQISTLLNQSGVNIGITDFLIEIPKTA